jgi:hypothetical protein
VPRDARPCGSLAPSGEASGAEAPRRRRGGRAARLAQCRPAAVSRPRRAGAPAPEAVRLVACGALAHEVNALIRLNGWTHFSLRCLPAQLHLHPQRIPEAVEAAVAEARAEGHGRILVLYADCGTGGRLAARCEALGVEMIPGPHCYAFFDGVDAFAARAERETTAFYLSDFLVRQFDAFVWRPMGLDRHPELRDVLFGGYDRLIHLAQTEDASLDRMAREAAARLGLRHERRFTGYGDLAAALARA